VVVMSPRPGRIVDVIDIDLPRPRNEDSRESARYFELITAVRETLRGGREGRAGGTATAVASADRTLAEGSVG